MPYPTPHVALGFRWALAYLLPTPLSIHHEGSRVRSVRLKRDDVGGVFLGAPSTLCGFRDCPQGRSGLPVAPFNQHVYLVMVVLLPLSTQEVSALSLTYQARYVRVFLPRRVGRIRARCL